MKRRRVLVALIVLAVGLMAAVRYNGFPQSETNWWASDSLFDWVTTQAAVDGSGAYRPLGDLLAEYAGHDDRGGPSHPRSPGALVVQTVLLTVSPDDVLTLQTLIIVLAVTGMILVTVRVAGWPWWAPLPLSCLFFVEPVRHAFNTGSQAPLVGFLVVLSWWMLGSGDNPKAGIPLGVASVLKLFPLLLVPLLWVGGYRKSAVGTVVVAGGLVAAGLLLPGVDLGPAVASLTDAGDVYRDLPRNLSVVALLPDQIPTFSIPLVGLGLLVWWALRTEPDLDRMFMVASGAMIVLSPIVWAHYLTAAFPALIMTPVGLGLLGLLIFAPPDHHLAYLTAVALLAIGAQPSHRTQEPDCKELAVVVE